MPEKQITLGGKPVTLKPLTLGQLEKAMERLEDAQGKNGSAKQFSAIIDIVAIAVGNDIGNIRDLPCSPGELQAAMAEVLALSGLAEAAPAGEAAAPTVN